MGRVNSWASRARGVLLAALAGCGGAADEPVAEAPASPPIVLDQFGYRPSANKIAFVRVPVTGFDAGAAGVAAETYQLIDAAGGRRVRDLRPAPQAGGNVDPASGDRVWTLDFSAVTTPGTYRIVAVGGGVSSPEFEIAGDVYAPVLREAFRTFYYQRAGLEKRAPFADLRWADRASHLGPGQDRAARDFFRKDDAATALDLSGGWYDAGDFNQYTNWTATYARQLLLSHAENPGAWGDDFGIPESGNGTADVIDEALWGLDWLARMQQADGGMRSILGRAAASPPSAATGPSYYGPASTSASLSAAASFAYAALVSPDAALARNFTRRAVAAWDWAAANPDVVFYNNDARSDAVGLGAGQQEVDDNGRNDKRFAAATYLFALTGEARFLGARDAAIGATQFGRGGPIDPYQAEVQDALVFLAGRSDTPAALKAQIVRAYGALKPAGRSAYGVPLGTVHWGSNGTMAASGVLQHQAARLASAADTTDPYLHYLHGANPLGKTYLSNMRARGAENSVDQMYHAWFADGSAIWDSALASRAGPAPGFLVGGPNPAYVRDACCPRGCGSAANNRRCETPLPPALAHPVAGQPPLKAYADVNTDWPVNSWQITENSNSYQVAYLRLLAHSVD
jgi:endoglucanase